jgi:TolB-like protein
VAARQDCKEQRLKSAYSSEEILQQFRRIVESPDFSATPQQRAFLEFVVTQTLSGKGHNIKGYTIATQVLGRDENFDQAIDPIVSIQANKLRRALERYYLLSGKEDTIHLEIPWGTYVPVFKTRTAVETKPVLHNGKNQDTCFEESLPAVLIKPFTNLTNDKEKDYLGAGFAAELATEINRFQSVCVLQYGSEEKGKRSSDTAARFVIEGNIRGNKNGIKVVVNLIDAKNSKQKWSGTQRLEGDLTTIIKFQEEVASIFGAVVAGEHGIISRILSVESKKIPPGQLKTYEAILRYHQYDQTLTPGDFRRAYEALEIARINEPECGQVWTFLARLHANIFSLEIPGFDVRDSENKAIEYAEKGARLNPDNQGARAMLAFVRMLNNDIAAARREINLAFELNPESLYMMDGIGYVKTLLGEWEQGPALIRKAKKLNPYYKPLVHYALWVDCLRQHDFQKAYLETTGLRKPAIFWYPLAKASTLGLLDEIAEGRKYAEDLLQLKPDFEERGRTLIGRYIKFDNIADLVIEGLDRVGVTIDCPA